MYSIATVGLGKGALGIAPIPGKSGDLGADVRVIAAWGATEVVTLTEAHELETTGAMALGMRLADVGATWHHLPIVDYQIPAEGEGQEWAASCAEWARKVRGGARILIHCKGGCGRSGMVLLRVLVESGEHPEDALARLREVRPCAVETDAQMAWATDCVITQI